MTAPRPVRAGLIGYGYAGRVFHAPLIDAVDGLELAAIGSSNPDKVHADRPEVAVDTPEAVIARDDLDLIVIATPNDTHAPLAGAALAAGRHLVVDKPFALDLAEARGLIAAADTAKRHLAVFHNRRWDSDFLSMAAAIRDNAAGTVSHLESHIDRFRPAVRDRWRERAQPGGGIWYDLGPHLIDQALCLFGLPQQVTCRLGALRPGADADDWAHAVLSYPGLCVILHASMLVAGGSARFTVHGTGGSIVKQRIDRQEAQMLAGMKPGAPGWGTDDDAPVHIDGEGTTRALPAVAGDQRRFYVGLRDSIRHGAPNPVPPVEALAVMAVLEAGFASARQGRALPPPLTDAEAAAYAAGRAP